MTVGAARERNLLSRCAARWGLTHLLFGVGLLLLFAPPLETALTPLSILLALSPSEAMTFGGLLLAPMTSGLATLAGVILLVAALTRLSLHLARHVWCRSEWAFEPWEDR